MQYNKIYKMMQQPLIAQRNAHEESFCFLWHDNKGFMFENSDKNFV